MGIYRDSVGGTYSRLPSKPERHTAKSTHSNSEGMKRRSERRPRVGDGRCGCEFCRAHPNVFR